MALDCAICGEPFADNDIMIGCGDGGGQLFGHRVCYHLRDMLHEALPWCPGSVQQRIRHHAEREHITLVDV